MRKFAPFENFPLYGITPHALQLKTMMMTTEWVWRALKEHLRVSMITMNNCKQVNQEE